MLLHLRKFDLYGQLTIMILMILSIPILFLYGPLMGLFILGCWQLISAAINSCAFIKAGFRHNIVTYWSLAGFDLLMLLLTQYLDVIPEGSANILSAFCLFTAGGIAVYYWLIESRLIKLLEERHELSAFTKSKL